ILNRWRDYLQTMSADDPVFFAWVKLQGVEPERFEAACEELVRTSKEENGDPTKFRDMHRLATEAPRWNPRVLDAIDAAKPSSLIALAETYGLLFADVHHDWL